MDRLNPRSIYRSVLPTANQIILRWSGRRCQATLRGRPWCGTRGSSARTGTAARWRRLPTTPSERATSCGSIPATRSPPYPSSEPARAVLCVHTWDRAEPLCLSQWLSPRPPPPAVVCWRVSVFAQNALLVWPVGVYPSSELVVRRSPWAGCFARSSSSVVLESGSASPSGCCRMCQEVRVGVFGVSVRRRPARGQGDRCSSRVQVLSCDG